MEYKIERFGKEKIKDLVYIFEAVHHKKADASFFERKFNTAFSGKEYIGYIAFAEDGEPASFYGVFPCYLFLEGRKILAAQSGDTITNVRHQKKGLFTLLAKKTYELAKLEGIQIIFGFPNENSLHGFVKYLDWKCPEKFKVFEITVSVLPLLKASHKFWWFRKIYTAYIKLVDWFYRANFSAIENSCIDEINGGVFRDQKFYEYKRSYGNSKFLKLGEFNVWCKVEDALQIGDIKKFDAAKFDLLLKKLKTYCLLTGIHRIYFEASPESFLEMQLRNKFQATEGSSIGFLMPDETLSIDCSKFKFTFGDVDVF